MIVQQEIQAEEFHAKDNRIDRPAFFDGTEGQQGMEGKKDSPGNDPRSGSPHDEIQAETKGKVPAGDVSFNSSQWLDLFRWAHHSEALSEDQRVKIIRMGRLIHKDRKLTKSQQEQVREILTLAQTLGYNARR